MNGRGISVFHKEVCQMWMKVLRRRSQKHNLKRNRLGRQRAPATMISIKYPPAYQSPLIFIICN
jgi:hypothetical protein